MEIGGHSIHDGVEEEQIGMSHDRTQEVLRKGKQELEALKECIYKVRATSTLSPVQDWPTSVSRNDQQQEHWGSESDAAPLQQSRLPPGVELNQENLMNASEEHSAWDRIVTWVAEDSVVTGGNHEVTGPRPVQIDGNMNAQDNNKGTDSFKEARSTTHFSSRIQAVARREAEALVDKVAAENRVKELEDKLNEAERLLSQNELDSQMAIKREEELRGLLALEKNRSAKLESNLEKLRKEHCELQAQFELVTQDLQDQTKDLETLSWQLKISESSRCAMEATLDKAQENVAEMQKEVQEMKLSQFQYQHTEMKKASDESKSLQDALVSISQCVMAGMRSLPNAVHDLTSGLESAVKELEDIIDEIPHGTVCQLAAIAEETLSEVLHEVSVMHKEHRERDLELQELRDLHAQTGSNLKDQQEESSRKLAAYAAEISDALSEVHRMASGMEDLQKQIQERDEKIEDLRDQLQRQNVIVVESNQTRMRLESVSQSQQLELDRASQLCEEKGELEARILKLKEDAIKAQEEIKSLRDALETKENRIKELRIALISATDTNAQDLKAQLLKANEDKEHFKKEAEDAHRARDSIEVHLSQLKKELETTQKEVLEASQQKLKQLHAVNDDLLGAIKVIMSEMKDAVSVAKLKLNASVTVLKENCKCDVEPSSLSSPLDNAAQIVELWLSGDAYVTPSELIKSHLISLTVHSMTWCIDCLNSELCAIAESGQKDHEENKEMQMRCKKLRSCLESALEIGQLSAQKIDSVHDDDDDEDGGSGFQDHNYAKLSSANDTDLQELAGLVVEHVKRLSWVAECGNAEITSLKTQVKNFESIVEASQATKANLQRNFNSTKAEVADLRSKLEEVKSQAKKNAAVLEERLSKEIERARQERIEAGLLLEAIKKEANAKAALREHEHEEKIEVLRSHSRASESKIRDLEAVLMETQHSVEDLRTIKQELHLGLQEAVSEKKELDADHLELKAVNKGLAFELKVSKESLQTLQADTSPGKLVLSVHRAQLALIRTRRRALFKEAYTYKVQCKQHKDAEEKLRAQLRSTKREFQMIKQKHDEDAKELEKTSVKMHRLEVLVPKLEERRRSQESEKKRLQDRVKEAQEQILDLESKASCNEALRKEAEAKAAGNESDVIHERERVQELSAKLLEAKVQLEKMVNLMSTLQEEHTSTLQQLAALTEQQKSTEKPVSMGTEKKVQDLMGRLEAVESEVQHTVEAKMEALQERDVLQEKLNQTLSQVVSVHRSDINRESSHDDEPPRLGGLRDSRSSSFDWKKEEEFSHGILQEISSEQKLGINSQAPPSEASRDEIGIKHDKATECALDYSGHVTTGRGESCDTDPKSLRLQELRAALARTINEKDAAEIKLEAARKDNRALKGEVSEKAQQLDDMIQKYSQIEIDAGAACSQIKSSAVLDDLVQEASPLKEMVRDWLDEVSGSSKKPVVSRMHSSVDGLLECLKCAKSLILSEKEAAQKGMEMLNEEMNRKFSAHVIYVEKEFSVWEERVSKGSKLLKNLGVVLEEVKGKLEKDCISDGESQGRKSCEDLEVECSELSGEVARLQEKLKEADEGKMMAIQEADKYISENEDLQEEVLKAQRMFDEACDREQKSINAITVLESKANKYAEAAQEHESRINMLEGLCRELKSRLVESVALSEGQDEQLTQLKGALNTALHKLKILKEMKQTELEQDGKDNIMKSAPSCVSTNQEASGEGVERESRNGEEQLHDEMETVSHQVKELCKKVQSLECEKGELLLWNQNLSTDLEKIKAEYEELLRKSGEASDGGDVRHEEEMALSQMKREAEAKSETIKELLMQKEKMEGSISESQGRIQQLQQELSLAIQKVHNLETNAQAARSKIHSLTEELLLAKEAPHQDASSTHSGSAASDMGQCAESMQNALSSTLPNMERIVGLWKAACEARQSRVHELEGILSHMTQQHKDWRQEMHEELEAKQGDVLKLQKELLSARSYCDRLMEERNNLREQAFLSKRDTDQKDIELADCQDVLDLKIREMQESKSVINQLQKEVEKAEREREEVKRELDEVQDQARIAKGQMQEFEDALQETLNRLNNSITVFQEATEPFMDTSTPYGASRDIGLAATLKEAADTLHKYSKKVRAQLQQAEIQVGSTSHRLSEAEKCMDTQKDDINRLENETRHLMEVCNKQSNDAHHYKERCSTLEMQLQEVQMGSEQWRLDAMKKDSEMTRLSEEMDMFSKRSEELGDLIADKARECANAVQEVKIAHHELKEAREANSVMGKKIIDLKRLLAVSKKECENAIMDRDEQYSQLQTLKAEKDASFIRIQSLEEEVSRKVMEIRELNHMLRAWEAMRAGKDAQMSALIERCKRLEHSRNARSLKGIDSEGNGSDRGSDIANVDKIDWLGSTKSTRVSEKSYRSYQ